MRIRVATHLKVSQLTRDLPAERGTGTGDAAGPSGIVAPRQQAEEALHAAGERLSLLTDIEADRWGVAAFIGKSKTLAKIVQDVRRLQNFTTVNVLIRGEEWHGQGTRRPRDSLRWRPG